MLEVVDMAYRLGRCSKTRVIRRSGFCRMTLELVSKPISVPLKSAAYGSQNEVLK